MHVNEILSRLTLEEKAGLLSGLDFWRTKPVERLGVPSVMMSDGPHGLRKQALEGDHLGINGSIKAVAFPAGCALAASFDRSLALRMGKALGEAARAERLCLLLGPAVNIKRSPLCGRNFEYLSEDPFLSGELAACLTSGVQSQGVGVSVKHFAANNQENRRMTANSRVDERTLREIYFPAFETVVKRADPWSVMCSYNRINGVYACENPWLLTKILRDEWGFNGFVVSDWGATDERADCLKAGMDLEMPSSGGANDRKIVEAVKRGELSEQAVDRAVERILTVIDRYLAGPAPSGDWDREAQHALSRELAAECMVLLKNEDGVLPLPEDGSVAIIGPFAKKPRYQGGGSSHVNAFRVESAMDVLGGRPGVSYAEGFRVEDEEPDEDLIREAEALAQKSERCVIFAGLSDARESEGYDREDLRLPRGQVELIRRVAATNPQCVVVLHNGAPVEMPWIGAVKGVLEAYLGGEAAGAATADLLLGKSNPSGRLPESFPLRLEDAPCYPYYRGDGNNFDYREGILVGYRYYETKKAPVLFPFGHGLSYTSFSYGNLRVNRDSLFEDQTLEVSVDVTNTGKRPGKEVVQLYVSDPVSSVVRPARELKGFDKVFLLPGETRTVRFLLERRAFAFWCEDCGDWRVETGEFAIEIGKSSREIALRTSVQVQSKLLHPKRFDRNTSFSEAISDARGKEIVGPVAQRIFDALAPGDGLGGADEAITKEMLTAMLKDSPLRSAVNFSGGLFTQEDLDHLLNALNGN